MAVAANFVDSIASNNTAIKLLGVFYMFALHICAPMKKTYDQRYGRRPSSACHLQPGLQFPSPQPRPTSRKVPTSQPLARVEGSSYIAGSASCGSDIDWRWQGLPTLWPWLSWFRTTSTMYMIYTIIKSILINIAFNVQSLLGLDSPVHCYTLGRFVIQEEVSQTVGCLFASYHLGWRYVQRYFGSSMFCTSMYILLVDRQDIELYLKTLHSRRASKIDENPTINAWRRSPSNQTSGSLEMQTVDKRYRFIRDIMCFRIEYGNETKYELRPNRTLEVCDKLRRFLVIFTIGSTILLMLLTLVITTLIFVRILNVRTYLYEYPGCSPEVHELEASGQLPGWSFKLVTTHQVVALLADIIENFLVWFESGLVAAYDFPLTIMLNYDLYLYWNHVDKDVEETLRLVMRCRDKDEERAPGRRQSRSRSNASMKQAGDGERPNYKPNPFESPVFEQSAQSQQLADRIYKLQMLIQDFIKETEQANKFINDTYSVILTMWFTIFAYWTYKIFSQAMPPSITILLSVLLIIVSLTGVIILSTQWNCKKTYPKICSLMAYDQSQYKKNFVKILEYFVKNRTCFTIFRGYVMRSTTLLTIFGYSFSCFFIVGSMYNR